MEIEKGQPFELTFVVFRIDILDFHNTFSY